MLPAPSNSGREVRAADVRGAAAAIHLTVEADCERGTHAPHDARVEEEEVRVALRHVRRIHERVRVPAADVWLPRGVVDELVLRDQVDGRSARLETKRLHNVAVEVVDDRGNSAAAMGYGQLARPALAEHVLHGHAEAGVEVVSIRLRLHALGVGHEDEKAVGFFLCECRDREKECGGDGGDDGELAHEISPTSIGGASVPGVNDLRYGSRDV